MHRTTGLASLHLTHRGRVTRICVVKLTIIGSDNGLSPGRRQAIIWTSDGILLIRTLGTNFSEILIAIHTFSFKKNDLKMSYGKWRPSCLGLNVLTGARGIPHPLSIALTLTLRSSLNHDGVMTWNRFPYYWIFVSGARRSRKHVPRGQSCRPWIFALL